MKIELKNVKYSKFASRGTDCFEASIYIDGKKEGTVGNRGSGGANNYYPSSLFNIIDTYAKTLPEENISHLFNDGKEHFSKQNADGLIGDIFNKYLLKKDCAKRTMFRDPNYTYKNKDEYHSMNCKFTLEIKKELISKYGDKVFILNETF